MNKFLWPLNNSSFTILDRIKICLFFLNFKNFWTQGKYVKKFVGCKFAVFVANGSVANTLLAMFLKDNLKSKAKEIIFPSTTWTTSISPFIREGFTPKFIDISLDDCCLDLSLTEEYLKKNHKKVAAIFCVSLIGQVPDIKKLQYLEKKYNVRVFLDNCENTLGLYNNKNISSYFTSTTSTYFGHQLQSDYFLMARNHGMTRSLSVYNIDNSLYKNPDVNPLFDFNIVGNNFRNTDVHAFIGLLDFSRVDGYIKKRHKIYNQIVELLGKDNLILPKEFLERTAVPFCFPILSKDKNFIDKVLSFCREKGVETRPIISGNLLRQTCYKKYGDYKKFKNSEFLHQNGFYIGIFPSLKDSVINVFKEFK